MAASKGLFANKLEWACSTNIISQPCYYIIDGKSWVYKMNNFKKSPIIITLWELIVLFNIWQKVRFQYQLHRYIMQTKN